MKNTSVALFALMIISVLILSPALYWLGRASYSLSHLTIFVAIGIVAVVGAVIITKGNKKK